MQRRLGSGEEAAAAQGAAAARALQQERAASAAAAAEHTAEGEKLRTQIEQLQEAHDAAAATVEATVLPLQALPAPRSRP